MMSFAMIEEHTLDAKEILRAREALIELSNYCEEAEFFCEEAKEDGSCQHERCVVLERLSKAQREWFGLD